MPQKRISSPDKLSLVLLDKQIIARRKVVIEEAAVELAKSDPGSVDVGLEYLPATNISQIRKRLTRQSSKLIMVVVHEDDLSGLTDEQKIPRIPCESVALSYSLLDHVGANNDLYVVVRDITGVDVISLLLSGVRGVIDVDAIGSSKILKKLVNGTSQPDKRMHRLLIGRPYLAFNALVEMARVRLQIPIQHWRLLLALAEIPVRKLNCDLQPKQKQIANEMSKYEDTTGYVVTNVTSRQLPLVLQLVAGELGLLGEDNTSERRDAGKRRRFLDREEMFELPYLPSYARELGLSSCLLPVRGLDQSQLADYLYKGLRGIETALTSSLDGIALADLTMPRSL